jgi:dolichol-phosphate mannosyltransferase
LFYGIQHALGETIVTLDGDGQNDPADIPRLIDALADGDVAAGIRADRHDSFLRIAMSRFANGIRSRVLGDGIPDTGCGLKAFRNEVRHALVPIRTLYSFMPAMMCAAGYKIVQVPVHHRPRQKGVSKYGFMVFLWRPLVDMPSSAWFTHRCVNQALLGAISVTLNEPPPPGL